MVSRKSFNFALYRKLVYNQLINIKRTFMTRRGIFANLLFLFSALVLVEEAFAGAWTVPKHKVWAEYYMKWNYAKEEFTIEGKRKILSTAEKNARSQEFVMEPKIEYGLRDDLNLLFGLEYKESHYKEYGRQLAWGDFARKNHGITNVKFGAKYRLLENPVVLSVQGRIFIYPGYGIYHGDDPAYTNQPSIGKGDDAFELRALIGKKFDINVPFWAEAKLPCYVGAETGYRWRNRHVANDIPYFVEAGFWPVNWLLIKSEIDGYKYHGGTGSIRESYGIWRIGGVWEIFGDSVLREGNKLFNIEFQYGMTVWGKSTTAYQEWVLKAQAQF
ncbi:MAG: hypothetical protein A2987_04360 [Omnitrophica bacterium RIFCSPLOWO2_01_FULL_45_10]|nr:MAG: hypothetical protein A2987_04360 [Omnitrophica bacterium RIFCSPLOWO2_01_FULL_45_10]